MANQQLIQTAKDLGASKGFNDIGATFKEGIAKGIERIVAIHDKKEAKRKEGDAIVAKFMDNLPSDAKLPNIPNSAKEDVANYLKDSRMQYAEHANAVRTLEPKDLEYQKHVSAMNKITTSWGNLKEQFNKLVGKRIDYIHLKDQGGVSKGNSPERVSMWSNIVADKNMKVSIGDGGYLSISTNNKNIALDELPKVIKKDDEALDAVHSISEDLIKHNLLVTEGNRDGIRDDIRDEITTNGINSVRSLATDNAKGGLKLDHDLLYNPKREEELIDTVVEQWLNITTRAAAEGRKQKEDIYKAHHPVKPAKVDNFLDPIINENINN